MSERLCPPALPGAMLPDKAVSELGGAKPALVTVQAIIGFAADELLAAAGGADMLVLGARGGAQASGLAAHSPIGSVSNKVLHRATCPVVVIPSGD
jgi:nucleotide-binding universal stress UspA family protein